MSLVLGLAWWKFKYNLHHNRRTILQAISWYTLCIPIGVWIWLIILYIGLDEH